MIEKAAFTMVEFAERHGIERHKLYEEIKTGRLRTYMLGRKRMVSRKVADEWQAQIEMAGDQPAIKSKNRSGLPEASTLN